MALATIAAVLGTSGAAPQVGGVPAARAADAPARVHANGFLRWRPGPSAASSRLVERSRVGRLLLRLRPGAAGGAAWQRLVVPRGVKASVLVFRVSYSTPAARVFIAAGSPSRRIWSRGPGRSALRQEGRVQLSGRRTIYVGIAPRGRAPRRRSGGFIVVHSYAVGGPGLRAAPPSPRGAGTPSGAREPALPPAEAAGPAPKIYWGARIGGSTYGPGFTDAPWDIRTLARFEEHAGKRVSIIIWGQPWYHGGVPQRFAPNVFDAVRSHGAIPMIDWSPWDLADGGYHEMPAFQLRDVIDGTYDAYIREWASAAAAWGHPFFLRYCHEMNGTWYPWSERSNGNSAGEFVDAWRHVHDIFEAVGARNVTWVWAPNEYEAYPGIPVAGLYPGNAYVDWVGMSGYNWGSPSPWRPFTKTFSRTYADLRSKFPSKPMMIAEIGSSERGGSKASWLRDAFNVQIPQKMPAVKAVVYWNKRDEGMDWPIESSPAAQAAFAQVIGSPDYAANRYARLTASPIPAP